MRAPTLREVIAESGGAEVVKRTGRARIEGVDYVRRPAAEWLASGKPTRGTRKPTADELASRWAMAERHWSASAANRSRTLRARVERRARSPRRAAAGSGGSRERRLTDEGRGNRCRGPQSCSKYPIGGHSMDEDTRQRLERLVLERDDARRAYDAAQGRLVAEVMAVLDGGEPGAEVARTLRVSRQAVHQLRKREAER